MNLAQTSQTFLPPEDQSWLGSAHGTDSLETITLDVSAFTATFTDGVIPSGVALGKITATGLYAPYDDAAVDGSAVMTGFLYTTKDISAGDTFDIGASMLTHGKIRVAKLPTDHGLDAAGRTDVAGRIQFLE